MIASAFGAAAGAPPGDGGPASSARERPDSTMRNRQGSDAFKKPVFPWSRSERSGVPDGRPREPRGAPSQVYRTISTKGCDLRKQMRTLAGDVPAT